MSAGLLKIGLVALLCLVPGGADAADGDEEAPKASDHLAQPLIHRLGSESTIEFNLDNPRRFNPGLKGVRGVVRQDGSTQLTTAIGPDVAVRILNVDAAQREMLFRHAVEGVRRFRLAEERPTPETKMRLKLSAGTAEIELGMDDAARADVVVPIARSLNRLFPADERVNFPGWPENGSPLSDPIQAVHRLPLRLPEQPLLKRLPEKWDLSLRTGISSSEETFIQASSNGEVFFDDQVSNLSAKPRRIKASETELRHLLEEAIEAAHEFEFVQPGTHADDRTPMPHGCLLKIRSRYASPSELSPSSWIRIEEKDAGGNPNFEKALAKISQLVKDLAR